MLSIELPCPNPNTGCYIALRPEDIVIILKPLESSIRNSFVGSVHSIIDQGSLYEVHICVQDMVFKSLVTKGTAGDLGLDVGMGVQISFKSSAVHIF